MHAESELYYSTEADPDRLPVAHHPGIFYRSKAEA